MNCETSGPLQEKRQPSLNNLPMEIIYHILDKLAYEEVASKREVSRTFDDIGRTILNKAFFSLGTQLEKSMFSVKKMLPKRESQRRRHPLARVNEVYSALETRYALLSMTFRKYIDHNSCCFIAGKVLDETFAVLRVLSECVRHQLQPRETQELLKDIRDYSSMAMEYFDEHIAPSLRLRDPLNMFCGRRFLWFPESSTERVRSHHHFLSPSTSRTNGKTDVDEIRKEFEEKWGKQERVIVEQNRIIIELSKSVNGLIECVNEIGSIFALNFTRELKEVDVNPPQGVLLKYDEHAADAERRKRHALKRCAELLEPPSCSKRWAK